MTYTDPETLMHDREASLNALHQRMTASGLHSGAFYEQVVLEDNAARAAGRPPVLDEHQRAHAERIVGPNPRGPEVRRAVDAGLIPTGDRMTVGA